jgi:hypothetical protein
VVTLWVLGGIVTMLAAWTGWNTRRSDFQMLWTSAHQWWTGTDPYAGAVAGADLNPPFVILLLTPLGWLPSSAAFALWTLLGWLCAGVAASLIARACRSSSWLTIMAVALVTVGGATATASGQLTWPLLLLVTLGWVADRQQATRTTGAVIGAMTAIKLFFGLWFVDLVLRRAGRVLAIATAVVLVGLLLGLLVHGMDGYASWLDALGRITWTEKQTNASLLGMWTRVLPPADVYTVWAASAAVVAAGGVGVAWRRRDADIRWAVLILTALLVSPLGWVYYVPLALGPLWALHVRRPLAFVDSLLLVAWCIPVGSDVPSPAGRWWLLIWTNRYTWGLLALWLRALCSSPPAGRTPRRRQVVR